MRPFLADLHVHTVLSPCADDLMLPRGIVAAALRRDLSLVGICDHNASENVAAVQAAAVQTGVSVLAGMEVTSREEVHVLALFPDLEVAAAWQGFVYGHLPLLPNNERAFGVQLVVDERDEIVSVDERLLLTATNLTLAEIAAEVDRRGGLAIPAHVDRPAFSIISQLGFVPPDLAVPALEVSARANPEEPRAIHPSLAGWRLVQSSDAHFLGQVGAARTLFWLEEPTFAESRLACRGEQGRRIEYCWGRG